MVVRLLPFTMFTTVKELSLLCLLSSLLSSTGIELECEERTVCTKCLIEDARCMWCADEGIRRTARCQEELSDCIDILDPMSEITSQKSQDDSVVPNTLKVSLRPGETLPLLINVTTARNIPLDLYIVFDVSQSLQEEFEATQQVSQQIFNNLRAITSNAHVGAGSFIDKTIRPYTRINITGDCVSSTCYNFRHYQSLTSDNNELVASLNSIETGSNIDAPEAGLDALAQIALCDDDVGWRDDAVKIVLYFTDDAFKFAGEGRYAGIMKPFEEVCKLETDPDSNDFLVYTGLENDYTSPGQLLRLLKQSNINPVFVAVTSETQNAGFYNVLETHQALAEMFNIQLNGGASAAELDSVTNTDPDAVADNVLRTIDEQVLNILERPRLMPNADGINGLSYTIEADCPPGAERVTAASGAESCRSVSVGNTTEFTLYLTLDSCEQFIPEPRNLSVRVFPLGEVTIEITPICECDCDDFEVNSTRCSFNGNYSCGECLCEDGYCGVRCQIREEDQSECPRGADGEFCSGVRGTCFSCECVCLIDLTTVITDSRLTRDGVDTSAYGRACECDFFSCLDVNNDTDTEVCSSRGMCCDGTCLCDMDVNGYLYRSESVDNTDCNCDPAEIVCTEPGSTDLCSGRGDCGCDRCDCPVPYAGQYCQNVSIEECYEIATEPEVEQCILAEQERTAQERDICQPCEFNLINVVNVSCVLILSRSEQPTSVDQDEVEREIEAFAASKLPGDNYVFLLGCVFSDDDGCAHDYYLLYNRDNLDELVYVAEEDNQRTCPETGTSGGFRLPLPLWALALILVVVLLVLGIILLIIIKAVFMVLDYFEVKRLEKEVGLADFSKNQNPLYQSPDVEYKNVAYGKE